MYLKASTGFSTSHAFTEISTDSVCRMKKSCSLDRFFQHEYSTTRLGSYSPGPCVFVCTTPAKNRFGRPGRGFEARAGPVVAVRPLQPRAVRRARPECAEKSG